MRTVAVALYDSIRVFDYAVIAEVWGVNRSDSGVPPFTLMTCAARRQVTGGYGTTIRATHPLAALADADLIVVPGNDVPPRPAAPALMRALRRAHERGTPVAALCGGAFVLAEAGLLDGRRAITHWFLADEFRDRFPQVQLEEGGLFVHDGGVWTSAGTAAGIDLCLELVRRAHGAEIAARIARRMVTPPHRSGGQAQYLARPTPADDGSEDLGDVLFWARERLDQPLTVAELAARARMSPRHFARRFTEATGATPALAPPPARPRRAAAPRRNRAAGRADRTTVRVRLDGSPARAVRPRPRNNAPGLPARLPGVRRRCGARGPRWRTSCRLTPGC